MTDLTARLTTALADRYTIERELGAGGMATVYLAHDVKHRRPVAIKVLRPELAAALGPERFLREIETTAALHHPHILSLYDSGEAVGFLFYVMPFVEGESLRDRLDREKQLPLDDALQIAREVADALSYAHQRGVIHRDIKPENILVASGHAVVADFGIARAITAAGGTKLTETGLAIGTPAYMSPEQAAGSGELDGRSDLYSLGCVLYEMLAGEPPFTGPTVESLVHQHLAVDAPSVTNLRPAVPPQIAGVLRRALAKAPADRFNPVVQFSDALMAGATQWAAAPATTERKSIGRRRRWIPVLATVTVIAAMAVILDVGGIRRGVGGRGPLESLAVLPLENLSAEPGQEYFVDGMTDALISELSKIEALRVISRTSVMQYKGVRKPLPEIGRELNVDGIVEGSVLRDGNRIRVTAQLIDAAGDRHLWADSYDRELGDVLALHSEVARAIAGEVRVALTAGDEARLAESRPVDPEAHDLLLRGRYHWERGATEQGLTLLEQATEADPDYAMAWAALARAYASLARVEPSQLPKAKAAVRRAIELDPNLAEAQAALGRIAFYHDWDWETARRALERAIELNPGYEDAHQVYGDYFEIRGRWDEAIAEGIRSKQVNPVSASMRLNLGLAYTYAGQLDSAIAECRSALELDSLSSWAYFCLADAHRRKGDFTEAITAAEIAVELDSDDIHQMMLAGVYASAGQRDRAEAVLAWLESESRHRYVPAYNLGWIHQMLGDTDSALELLERAVDEHAAFTPWINSLPEFDALKDDPRFQALLRRMNLAG
jgi:serine/threonine-protein kinase